MNWNNVSIDFSNSGRSLGTAIAGMSSAGDIFNRIGENLAKERQNKFNNELALREADRADLALGMEQDKHNILMNTEEDVTNISNAINQAMLESVDSTGRVNLDKMKNILSDIEASTSGGSTLLTNHLNKTSNDRFNMFNADRNYGLDVSKFNHNRYMDNERLALEKDKLAFNKANLKANSNNKKDAMFNFNKNFSKLNNEDTALINNAIADIYRLSSDDSTVNALLDGLTPDDVIAVLSNSLKIEEDDDKFELTGDSRDKLGEIIYTLDSIRKGDIKGIDPRLVGLLIQSSVYKNGGANDVQIGVYQNVLEAKKQKELENSPEYIAEQKAKKEIEDKKKRNEFFKSYFSDDYLK